MAELPTSSAPSDNALEQPPATWSRRAAVEQFHLLKEHFGANRVGDLAPISW